MNIPKSILIICTGNSCRSPMAEGLLKKLLEGRPITVRSAGTAGLVGMKATEEAKEVARRDDIDISSHRSASLTKALIEEADLILVMESAHRDSVLSILPDANKKVHLLTEYAKDGLDRNKEIPDPIGKPLEVYERVYDMIKRSAEGLVEGMRR